MIGGQTLWLLLTLLVTPVAYSLLDDLESLWRARKGARKGTEPCQFSSFDSRPDAKKSKTDVRPLSSRDDAVAAVLFGLVEGGVGAF